MVLLMQMKRLRQLKEYLGNGLLGVWRTVHVSSMSGGGVRGIFLTGDACACCLECYLLFCYFFCCLPCYCCLLCGFVVGFFV
jgi:hypothetical protein